MRNSNIDAFIRIYPIRHVGWKQISIIFTINLAISIFAVLIYKSITTIAVMIITVLLWSMGGVFAEKKRDHIAQAFLIVSIALSLYSILIGTTIDTEPIVEKYEIFFFLILIAIWAITYFVAYFIIKNKILDGYYVDKEPFNIKSSRTGIGSLSVVTLFLLFENGIITSLLAILFIYISNSILCIYVTKYIMVDYYLRKYNKQPATY